MRRADIVFADLEPVHGAEVNKRRPVIVVGNDASLRAATRHGRGVVTVVPITSNTDVRGPMHLALRPTRLNGLQRESKAQAEQIRSLDVSRLGPTLGRLGATDIAALDAALRYHLAL